MCSVCSSTEWRSLHVTGIIPEVIFQRKTPILSDRQWLIVRRTIRSCVRDVVLSGIVEDMVQEGIRIKNQRRHILMFGRKFRSMPLQSIIPPPDHRDVWKRLGAGNIPRRPIQRRQIHEQPLLVARRIHRLDSLREHGGNQLVVETGKVDSQFLGIANVVDPNPHRHERLIRDNDVLEHGLCIVEELLGLVHELHGPVVVQRKVLDRDVGAAKGEVPQLDGAGLRVREALVDAALCDVLDPVGAAVGGAQDVFLLDSVGQELLWREGDVQVASDECVVGISESALGICVRVSKSDTASMESAPKFSLVDHCLHCNEHW